MSRARGERGFTLIEMIMVMMVLSIAAVSVLEAFSGNGRGLLLADNNHVAQNLAQECAEYIARSKQDGAITYGAITATVCDAPLPDVNGFSLTVDPRDVTSATCPGGANCLALCPSGALCKDTTIAVTKSGSILATAKILFVNY